MGADLYISSIYEANKARYKDELERLREQNEKLRARDTGEKTDPILEAEIILHDDQINRILEKVHEGCYFRDSYNCSNLLWCYGLSYWRSFSKFISEDGRLNLEGAEWLLRILKENPFPIDTKYILEKKEPGGESFFGLNEEDAWKPQQWVDYFIQKRKDMIAFLEKAIELKEEIYWSV